MWDGGGDGGDNVQLHMSTITLLHVFIISASAFRTFFNFFLVFTFRRATATFTLFTENDPSRVPIPLKRPAFFLMAIIPFNASHSVQVHEFMSS